MGKIILVGALCLFVGYLVGSYLAEKQTPIYISDTQLKDREQPITSIITIIKIDGCQ